MSGLLSPAPPQLPEVLRLPHAVSALFQPIVELDTGEPVALEALARGPIDTELERAERLFEAARERGCLAELDWTCRAAAVEAAMGVDLPRSIPVFVNVEPETLGEPCPARYAGTFALARERLRVVVELTERALTDRPADLLHAVARMREWGWLIALDDVGADRRSLALLPLLAPDVIKLDMQLIQRSPTTEIAAVVSAVNAEAERTGALILAEGIERDEHVDTARAMGATLGQGWLYGLPARLPQLAGWSAPGIEMPPRRWQPPEGTPYDRVAAVRDVRRSSKRLLLAMSRHLEAQARKLGETAVVLSAFQGAERFSDETASLYEDLARDAAFVAALGVGMPAEPAPGVRGADLPETDPLLGEWSVVVIGPHFAGALVAVDLGDDGPDADRRFDFALTYDRQLVVDAANSLMARVKPL